MSHISRQYGLELVIDEAQNRLDQTEVRGDLQQPLVADGGACTELVDLFAWFCKCIPRA